MQTEAYEDTQYFENYKSFIKSKLEKDVPSQRIQTQMSNEGTSTNHHHLMRKMQDISTNNKKIEKKSTHSKSPINYNIQNDKSLLKSKVEKLPLKNSIKAGSVMQSTV